MSYILDALRRADAERERGAVPGLNAQPLNDDDGEGPAARPASNPLVWVIVALALVLLATLGWQMMGSDPPPVETVAAVQAPRPAPTPEPVRSPTPAIIDTAPAAAVPVQPPTPTPTPAPSFAPAPAPTQRATPELPLDKPLPRPTQRPEAASDRPVRAAPTAAAPSPASATPTAAAPAAAESRILAVSELPDDVRRSLPTLSFGGSVYSETPANRILIINGQVYNEGGRPAPELVLEQIRLKSAVLRFRNIRYEVAY